MSGGTPTVGKVGRNDPCPCGSGLKYKRCHGSVVDPKLSVGNAPLNATAAGAILGGFPGQHQQFHAIFRFKEGDPRNDLPVMGAPGDYEVTFVLRRPGFPLLPEKQISFSVGHLGDSHLAIAKPAFAPPGAPDADQILIHASNEDGHFEFVGTPNKKGFLGKLTTRPFRARDRQHAEEIAYRALAPSLSEFSMHLDIPLEIGQIETKDLLTHSSHISLVTPQMEVPFAVNPTSAMLADYRGVASLYREALNSNSPVYQFLCFFKIIEALRARRKRMAREAKKIGKFYTPPVETLPRSPAEIKVWLDALFYARPEWDLMAVDSAVPADARGKTFDEVVEIVLRPLRVNVAHALFLDSGGELTSSSDDLLDRRKITQRLPLTKCIVRRMLKNEFAPSFLGHLPG